jgi:mannose-6-phosphate isomerase-like protein (cupin superfamily)
MPNHVIRNWRDETPYVSHNAAVIWSLLRPADVKGEKRDLHVLRGMTGVVKHALQPRKESDYHSHADIEQVYFILKGAGVMVIDGERHPVREGDVVYLPPRVMHQMLNEGDDWIEHLIISCPVREAGRS